MELYNYMFSCNNYVIIIIIIIISFFTLRARSLCIRSNVKNVLLILCIDVFNKDIYLKKIDINIFLYRSCTDIHVKIFYTYK